MSQRDPKSFWSIVTHFLEDSHLKRCGASWATCFGNDGVAALFLGRAAVPSLVGSSPDPAILIILTLSTRSCSSCHTARGRPVFRSLSSFGAGLYKERVSPLRCKRLGTTVSLDQEYASLGALHKVEEAGVLLCDAVQATCVASLG